MHEEAVKDVLNSMWGYVLWEVLFEKVKRFEEHPRGKQQRE